MQRKRRVVAAWSLLAVGVLSVVGSGGLMMPHLSHATGARYIVNDCTEEFATQAGYNGIGDIITSANTGHVASAYVTFDTTSPGTKCSPGDAIPITQTLDIVSGSMYTVTIDGGSNNITLNGTVSAVGVRLFTVESGAQLEIDYLTMENGVASEYGGAVYNHGGDVTIAGSTLSGNQTALGGYGSGGAIYSDGSGTVKVDSTTFDSNISGAYAGAIGIQSGTVTVTNSTFTGNKAAGGNGGAIANDATLTLANDTFWNNTAQQSGGAVASDGSVTIHTGTFANNHATTGSGGALANITAGTLNVDGSIVANNSGTNCSGTIGDAGYNLEPGTSCGFSQHNVNADPLLDSTGPASNGGPTQTIALADGSPAIGRIPQAQCTTTTDARGFSRPAYASAGCTIGAYEFAPGTALTLTTGSAIYGDDYTLKATVGFYDPTVATGQSNPSCGTVNFSVTPQGSSTPITTLGSVDIDNTGAAILQVSGTTLSAGTYTMHLGYNNGELLCSPADGASAGSYVESSLDAAFTVNPASTTITVSVSQGTAPGQPITLTAIVDPTVTPTGGEVTFFDGTKTLGNSALNNGVASLTVTLGPGTHTLSATYGGTTDFAASSTTASVKVTIAAIGTGRSGNGSTNAPQTAQASSKAGSTNGSDHGTTGAKTTAGTKTTTGVLTQPSSTFPLALVALLAILGFALIGGGAVMLARARKTAH